MESAISKKCNLTQITYNYILDMIFSKKLMPGEKIAEQRISNEINTSRTPVREALRQLTNDGLIIMEPKRFAKVAYYSQEQIHDIGILRLKLDSLSIRLAALFGSRADFLRLKSIAQLCADMAESGDAIKKIQYDSDFHLEIANIGKNDILIKFQKELHLRIQFILLHRTHTLSTKQKHLQQHIDIADALINHEEKIAIQISNDHLATFYSLNDRFPKDVYS